MQQDRERETNPAVNRSAVNFILARESRWRSLFSNLVCLLSRPDPKLTTAAPIQTHLMLKSDPWYRRVASNFRSLSSGSVEVQITAKPVDTGLLVTPSSRFRAAFENLKLLLRPQNFSRSGVIAQPIQNDLLLEPQPWFRSLLGGLREVFSSRSPLECTAQPVEAGEIFREYRFRKSSVAFSVVAHAGILIAVLFIPKLFLHKAQPKAPSESVMMLNANSLVYFNPTPEPKPKAHQPGGGGGGGQRMKTPASLGKLPKVSDRQLTPPMPEIVNLDPKIPEEPTVIVSELAKLPKLNLPAYGDPLGFPGPPSAGSGTGAGIGTGDGHGVGPGQGPGFGPGSGGNTGGGPLRVGGGVLPPTIIFKVEPTYSEEARKARYQGTVLLSAIVRRDGGIQILKVLRGLGLGLDENAISALQQWKFHPGTVAGQPVDVALNIEINFSLR
jgi:periplasmic protein TonB